jgi:hypothetical protein
MAYSVIAIWISAPIPNIQLPPPKPPTLADLFETDFPNLFKGADETVLDSTTDGTVLHIKRHVYMDFAAKTQFVAFYIPYLPSNHGNQAFDASMALVDVVQPTLDKLDKHVSVGGEVLPRGMSDWKNFVSNLIPKQFGAYGKILHQIDASYENIDNPLTERETEILKTPPCTELRSFVERLRKEERGRRIRWSELAQLFGVPFEAEICHQWFHASMVDPGCWPRFLRGPDDAGPNNEKLSAMISVLRQFAGSDDCFFRFAEIPLIGTDKPVQFCGKLDELSTFLADGTYQFPRSTGGQPTAVGACAAIMTSLLR